MNLFLDNVRPCPRGWFHARTHAQAVSRLLMGGVVRVSLDHTGYDVACWIEENAPHIRILCHSQNPVGRERIKLVAERLRRLAVEAL